MIHIMWVAVHVVESIITTIQIQIIYKCICQFCDYIQTFCNDLYNTFHFACRQLCNIMIY